MKLIVLTGLVVIEKAQVANALAGLFVKNYTSVTLIDNISSLPIEAAPAGAQLLRMADNLPARLPATLAAIEGDLVILAASESLSPDDLWTTLEGLYNRIADIDIHTIALLDDRTCDCFPTVRQQLEAHADLTLRAPFDVRDLLQIV